MQVSLDVCVQGVSTGRKIEFGDLTTFDSLIQSVKDTYQKRKKSKSFTPMTAEEFRSCRESITKVYPDLFSGFPSSELGWVLSRKKPTWTNLCVGKSLGWDFLRLGFDYESNEVIFMDQSAEKIIDHYQKDQFMKPMLDMAAVRTAESVEKAAEELFNLVLKAESSKG